MGTRIELHEELVKILGSRNVYFQPPENLRLSYPAIIYERTGLPVVRADNESYLDWHRYQVIIVDRDPDSQLVDTLAKFPHTRFVRHYSTEGFNHDVFEITY